METGAPEIITPPKRKAGRPVKNIASDLAIRQMLANGVPPGITADILGMSPSTISRVKARLAEQGQDIRPLLTPVRDEKIGKFVDRFMDAGIKMSTKKIKGSDALGAAKLYADRRYPVRAPDGGGGSVTYTEVNISLNLGQPGPVEREPIDITGQSVDAAGSIPPSREESNGVEMDYSL